MTQRAHVARLARRHVLAAPLAGVVAAAPRTAPSSATPRRAPTDPLVAAVRTFITQRAANDARARDWQQLEHTLARSCAPLTLTQATRSGLPAARAMRALARRIAATRRRLQRTAIRLTHTPATSTDGALAKLDLARFLLHPADAADTVNPSATAADTATTTAVALLRTGLVDARRLFRDDPSSARSPATLVPIA